MAKKNLYAHKWSTDVLEQVAHECDLVSNAQTTQDWELFLTAIYESIEVLSYEQRIVLLLSQEVGLTYIDMARILGKPLSTIVGLLRQAVDKVCFMVRSRSLADTNRYDCKALQKLRDEHEKQRKKEPIYEPADYEFIDQFCYTYVDPTDAEGNEAE